MSVKLDVISKSNSQCLDIVGRYNEILLDGNRERYISFSAQDNTLKFVSICIHIIVDEPVNGRICIDVCIEGVFKGYITMVSIIQMVIISMISNFTINYWNWYNMNFAPPSFINISSLSPQNLFTILDRHSGKNVSIVT